MAQEKNVLSAETGKEIGVSDEKLTDNLVGLDFEYQAAAQRAGAGEKTYGIFGPLWRLMEFLHSRRVYHCVNKKRYLILLVLLGWCGGHRFYERRWYLAALYFCFFWTGIPLAMCLLDALAVIPVRADENGCVVI